VKAFVGIKLFSSLSIIHLTAQIDEGLMPAFLPHQNQQNLTTEGTEFHVGGDHRVEPRENFLCHVSQFGLSGRKNVHLTLHR
jgi:hypothetical protein